MASSTFLVSLTLVSYPHHCLATAVHTHIHTPNKRSRTPLPSTCYHYHHHFPDAIQWMANGGHRGLQDTGTGYMIQDAGLLWTCLESDERRGAMGWMGWMGWMRRMANG
ncbi:hypothetical protein B0H34DRAFT_130033 [Crassisporium funariophilum]|nr:hypothetical protein B0H34DRAFT_130033 [Crassisporium funariophilum]